MKNYSNEDIKPYNKGEVMILTIEELLDYARQNKYALLKTLFDMIWGSSTLRYIMHHQGKNTAPFACLDFVQLSGYFSAIFKLSNDIDKKDIGSLSSKLLKEWEEDGLVENIGLAAYSIKYSKIQNLFN